MCTYGGVIVTLKVVLILSVTLVFNVKIFGRVHKFQEDMICSDMFKICFEM